MSLDLRFTHIEHIVLCAGSGEHIDVVMQEMWAVAMKYRCEVTTTFNEMTIIIKPE